MKTKLIPTQNNLREPIRRAMIDLLNQQLADVLDLGCKPNKRIGTSKVRILSACTSCSTKSQRNWRSYGRDRRARCGNGWNRAGHDSSGFKEITAICLSRDLAAGKGHITALSKALAKFGASARAAIDTAANAADADTADLFTEVSRGVDKTAVDGRGPHTSE